MNSSESERLQFEYPRVLLSAEQIKKRVQEMAREAMAELRAVIFELRPATVEDEGLLVALRKHVDVLRRVEQRQISFDDDGGVPRKSTPPAPSRTPCTSSPPTASGSKPANAALKASRLARIVRHDSPDWKASRLIRSKSPVSSRTGKPHSPS